MAHATEKSDKDRKFPEFHTNKIKDGFGKGSSDLAAGNVECLCYRELEESSAGRVCTLYWAGHRSRESYATPTL